MITRKLLKDTKKEIFRHDFVCVRKEVVSINLNAELCLVKKESDVFIVHKKSNKNLAELRMFHDSINWVIKDIEENVAEVSFKYDTPSPIEDHLDMILGDKSVAIWDNFGCDYNQVHVDSVWREDDGKYYIEITDEDMSNPWAEEHTVELDILNFKYKIL